MDALSEQTAKVGRSKRWWRGVCAGLAAFVLMGAVGAGTDSAVSPVRQGVTVRGQVSFHGPMPRADRLPVPRDSAFCGKTMVNESLRVDSKTHGVASAVVSFENGTGEPIMPQAAQISLDNHGCRFVPRVRATTAGAWLSIGNADPILHNTRVRKNSRYGETVVNVALPAGVKVIRKPLTEPGFLDVRCAAHPFMQASIHVFEHPYFAVTDETGLFAVTGVPPGTYRVRVWHEVLRVREQTVVVPDDGPVTLNLELDF
jgi:hypothetical protein